MGGVYDNRLLVKPTPSAQKLMPNAKLELPCGGATEALLVENIENSEFLEKLFEVMYDELHEPKKRK